MTTSSLDLSARADLQWLADLIGDAQRSATRAEWVIVGALARDLHLSYAHGIRIHRATADTDLAVTVAEWSDFASVRSLLIDGGAFKPDARMSHRLVHRSGRVIDIVPFGGIENSAGIIAWPPSGDVQMSVLGYREVLLSSVALILPQRRQVRMVSLVGLIVLKILAWSDRHRSQPGKDAYDLRILLTYYLDAGNARRLYEEHATS
jgi:predicted nucleotidyltransferase